MILRSVLIVFIWIGYFTSLQATEFTPHESRIATLSALREKLSSQITDIKDEELTSISDLLPAFSQQEIEDFSKTDQARIVKIISYLREAPHEKEMMIQTVKLWRLPEDTITSTATKMARLYSLHQEEGDNFNAVATTLNNIKEILDKNKININKIISDKVWFYFTEQPQEINSFKSILVSKLQAGESLDEKKLDKVIELARKSNDSSKDWVKFWDDAI